MQSGDAADILGHMGSAVSHFLAFIEPTNADDFWTMVLALATVGVVVVAGRGLHSLKLTRTEMHNHATRESVQSAIDRCEEMARELVPLYTEILANLTARKVSLFMTDPSQVSFDAKEEVQKINRAIAWMGQLDDGLQKQTVQLMNALEAWSMYFTHDPALADETVAFEPCSTPFCQMVMGLYPGFLTHRRTNPASGLFQNTVTLFNGWYAKKAQGPIFEQLKRFQSDGAKLPPPIGTRLDSKA